MEAADSSAIIARIRVIPPENTEITVDDAGRSAKTAEYYWR